MRDLNEKGADLLQRQSLERSQSSQLGGVGRGLMRAATQRYGKFRSRARSLADIEKPVPRELSVLQVSPGSKYFNKSFTEKKKSPAAAGSPGKAGSPGSPGSPGTSKAKDLWSRALKGVAKKGPPSPKVKFVQASGEMQTGLQDDVAIHFTPTNSLIQGLKPLTGMDTSALGAASPLGSPGGLGRFGESAGPGTPGGASEADREALSQLQTASAAHDGELQAVQAEVRRLAEAVDGQQKLLAQAVVALQRLDAKLPPRGGAGAGAEGEAASSSSAGKPGGKALEG